MTGFRLNPLSGMRWAGDYSLGNLSLGSFCDQVGIYDGQKHVEDGHD